MALSRSPATGPSSLSRLFGHYARRLEWDWVSCSIMEGAKNLTEVSSMLKGKAAGEPEPSSVSFAIRGRAHFAFDFAWLGVIDTL